jgi:hypothetical protein
MHVNAVGVRKQGLQSAWAERRREKSKEQPVSCVGCDHDLR